METICKATFSIGVAMMFLAIVVFAFVPAIGGAATLLGGAGAFVAVLAIVVYGAME